MNTEQPLALRMADAIGGWHAPAHPTIEHCDKAAAELRRLHAENEALMQHMAAIEAWKAEGEAYLNSPHQTGILFQVAAWWADRPWRVK